MIQRNRSLLGPLLSVSQEILSPIGQLQHHHDKKSAQKHLGNRGEVTVMMCETHYGMQGKNIWGLHKIYYGTGAGAPTLVGHLGYMTLTSLCKSIPSICIVAAAVQQSNSIADRYVYDSMISV